MKNILKLDYESLFQPTIVAKRTVQGNKGCESIAANVEMAKKFFGLEYLFQAAQRVK